MAEEGNEHAPQRGRPRTGIDLDGGGEFQQLRAGREPGGQVIDQVELRGDEQDDQSAQRAAQHEHEGVNELRGLGRARQPGIAQADEHGREQDEREQPQQPVHDDGQDRAGAALRRGLAQDVIGLHGVAARRTEQKQVEERADHVEFRDAFERQENLLHAQQNPPADRGRDGRDRPGCQGRHQPDGVRLPHGVDHAGKRARLPENPPQREEGHGELERGDEDFLHASGGRV